MILTFQTMDQARAAVRQLNGMNLRGRRIKAVMNTRPEGAAARYFVPESIKVTNIDMNVEAAELETMADAWRVREVGLGHVYNLSTCIRVLEARLSAHGGLPSSFQTTALEGDRMQAKVKFGSDEQAQLAFDAIERGLWGRNPPLRPFLPKGHQFTISIIRPQYDAQKALWDELAEGSKGKGAYVRVNESKGNGRMYIQVLGSNQQETGALKVRVENLVAGERLGTDYWHSSFLNNGGGVFLRGLKDSTSTFVSIDRKIQALRLFGTSAAKAAAKEAIQEEVERLNFLEWSIPLQRHSVGFFVRSGLKTLQDSLGEENVSLDLSSNPATIKIKGGDEARHQLRKIMDDCANLSPTAAEPAQGDGEGETCPICYDEVASPDTLSCGHSYCGGCLRHYLTSAADSKNFPLKCMGNEATCGQPVAIPIIQRYLTPQRVNRLVDAVFLAYLEQNTRTYKYCPTADCSQIYRCDENKALHQCPSCFFKVCGRCNEEVHEGINCEEARVQRNPAEQERLNEEWMRTNNAKRCPQCQVIIVKSEGCNHMTCRCGAHICWVCSQVFTSGRLVYDHMSTAHGGFYADVPAVPARAPAAPPRQPAGAPGAAARTQPPVNGNERLRAAAQEEADRRLAWQLQYDDNPFIGGGFRAHEAERQREQERVRLAEVMRQRREREAREREQMRLDFAREEERRRQAQRRESGGFCTIM